MPTTGSEIVHHLRRTLSPYIGHAAILSLVTAFLSVIMIHQRAWMLWVPMGGMWLLFLVPMYMGLRYGISWSDHGITQRASGVEVVCITWGDIERVATEVTRPGALLSASRPFRRIAIYGRDQAGAGACIDISLKHFAAADIEGVIDAVRRHRPGLDLPDLGAGRGLP